MKKLLSMLFLVILAPMSNATILLADNFDDGNTNGWTEEFFGNSISAADRGIEASTLDSVSGDYSLRTYFVSLTSTTSDDCGPPEDFAVGCGVRAVFDFAVAASDAGDYVLDLFARSRDCSGCTMYYEIFNDGALLASENALSFEQFTQGITLGEGNHTLKLGLRTTAAYSGDFQAFFDDVCIASQGRSECFPSTSVPEPGSLGLLGLGLFGLLLARRKNTA